MTKLSTEKQVKYNGVVIGKVQGISKVWISSGLTDGSDMAQGWERGSGR